MRRPAPEPADPCPCTSGLRFADCHGAAALSASAQPLWKISVQGCTFNGHSGLPILIGEPRARNPHNLLRALSTEAENPVVFKHLKAEHAKAMLEEGTVCLSKMSSFKYDEEPRGDAHEGFEHGAANGPAICRIGNFEIDATNVQSTTQVDGLIYCVSLDNRVRVNDGYDACVRIEDCDAFFDELRLASERHGPCFLGWARVEYTERDVPIETVLRDQLRWRYPGSGKFFRKPERFRSQREIRGAWDESDRVPGDKLVIKVPGIIRLLRREF